MVHDILEEMNEIELKFRVGRIMLNGRPYPFTEPVIRGPFKWIHIIPESYSPDNLKNSMMYLFENTWEGKVEMKFWLRENYLLRHFTNMEYHHNRMILYNNTQTSENKKNHRKKTKDHIKKKTDEFISELKDPKYNGIKISNPNLMDELNKPAHLADGPILSSSLVYKDTNFQCPEPATTDDVMYLNNLTFISDLDGVPFNNWGGAIRSAIVPSGCLRLFTDTTYGGCFVFLWGPNGHYPYIFEDFGVLAKSLQQTP